MAKLVSNLSPILASKNVVSFRLATDIYRKEPANTEEKIKATPNGIELPATEVKEIVEQALAGKLHSTYTLRLADSTYYLPTIDEVKQILNSTEKERRSWIPNRFDCDDFAYVLKAFMSSISYINNTLTSGLCGGIIWGKFKWTNEFHACNWILTSEKNFYLIEPQDNTLYIASECSGSVTFVAA